MTTQINGTSGITFSDSSVQNTAGINFRNRIINGAMVIDQRNAGASVTVPATTVTYTVDRWAAYGSQASKFTVQQSSTAPTGFTKSALITSSSAYTVGSSEAFWFRQPVEGFNVADLGWGAVGAATVTLSFWVRSSLTGTFGGSVTNATWSYPFSYTISSANTWEQKTVTIAGPTSGTWSTDNTASFFLQFGLGVGSTYSGTAGSWANANYASATGATSVVGTNGATFYITGVQLEKGTTASSFDFRSYGTELALCQRYLPAFSGLDRICQGMAATTSVGNGFFQFPVITRVAPTGVTVNSAGYFYVSDAVSYDLQCNAVSFSSASNMMAKIQFTTSSASQVANRPQNYWSNNSAAILYLTGCEL